MDKRTATVSARITPERERDARAIAMANDLSLSDLIDECLAERIERERQYALRLSAALGINQDLPGKHGERE